MAVTRNGNVIKMTAAADAVPGNFYIQKIRVAGVATAGDTVQINDAGGEIFYAKADTTLRAIDTDFYPAYMAAGNITVNTLTSGIVYIYVK